MILALLIVLSIGALAVGLWLGLKVRDSYKPINISNGEIKIEENEC